MDISSKDFARDRWKQARRNKAAHRRKFSGFKTADKHSSDQDDEGAQGDYLPASTSGTLANLQGAQESGVAALSTGADLEALLQDVEMKNYQAFCRHTATPTLEDPGEPPPITDALLSVNLTDVADSFNSLSLVDLVGVPAPYVAAAGMDTTQVRTKRSILEYFRSWTRKVHSDEKIGDAEAAPLMATSSSAVDPASVGLSASLQVTPVTSETASDTTSDKSQKNESKSKGRLPGLTMSEAKSERPLTGLTMSEAKSEIPLTGLTISEAKSEIPLTGLTMSESAVLGDVGDQLDTSLTGAQSGARSPSDVQDGQAVRGSSSGAGMQREQPTTRILTASIASLGGDDELDKLLGINASHIPTKFTSAPQPRPSAFMSSPAAQARPAAGKTRTDTFTAADDELDSLLGLSGSTSSTSSARGGTLNRIGSSTAKTGTAVGSHAFMSTTSKVSSVHGGSGVMDDDLDALLGLSTVQKSAGTRPSSTGSSTVPAPKVQAQYTATISGVTNTGRSTSDASSSVTSMAKGVMAGIGDDSLDALLNPTPATTSSSTTPNTRGTGSTSGLAGKSIPTTGVVQKSVQGRAGVEACGKTGPTVHLEAGLAGVLGDEDDDLDALLKGTSGGGVW